MVRVCGGCSKRGGIKRTHAHLHTTTPSHTNAHAHTHKILTHANTFSLTGRGNEAAIFAGYTHTHILTHTHIHTYTHPPARNLFLPGCSSSGGGGKCGYGAVPGMVQRGTHTSLIASQAHSIRIVLSESAPHSMCAIGSRQRSPCDVVRVLFVSVYDVWVGWKGAGGYKRRRSNIHRHYLCDECWKGYLDVQLSEVRFTRTRTHTCTHTDTHTHACTHTDTHETHFARV